MGEERKTLPAAVVPEEGYALLSDYAYSRRVSLSEALRRLLADSPALIAFADREGRAIDLTVNERGGYQIKKG